MNPAPANPNGPKAAAPKVKVQATGRVLNPGDPGYDDALARIRARQAEQAANTIKEKL